MSKDNVVSVRFGPDEFAEITALAERAGQTLSTFLRSTVAAVASFGDADRLPTLGIALRHHARQPYGEPGVQSHCGGPASCPICAARWQSTPITTSGPFELRWAT